MPERRPADDCRIYWHPTATSRCPASHRWATCRSSSGHQPNILSSAERIGQSPNSRPAVAGRRPLPDFYDMVQGRKNPVMICRCQKAGIGEKSGGHRRIYKACDVVFNHRQMIDDTYRGTTWIVLHEISCVFVPTRPTYITLNAIATSHLLA